MRVLLIVFHHSGRLTYDLPVLILYEQCFGFFSSFMWKLSMITCIRFIKGSIPTNILFFFVPIKTDKSFISLFKWSNRVYYFLVGKPFKFLKESKQTNKKCFSMSKWKVKIHFIYTLYQIRDSQILAWCLFINRFLALLSRMSSCVCLFYRTAPILADFLHETVRYWSKWYNCCLSGRLADGPDQYNAKQPNHSLRTE